MEIHNAADVLAALGHESRLSIFRLLVQAGSTGIHASAIGERLGLPAATLSFHLAHLGRVGLIQGRHEGRFIFYSANYPAMDELIAYLTDNCCGGDSCLPKAAEVATMAQRRRRAASPPHEGTIMTDRVYNVLFLCTGNSARSILAEAILNQLGKGRFRAYSAGSHPAGVVNPYAVELLAAQKVPLEGLHSKSWDEFSKAGAPELDFVFTVCDKAAGEVCPIWPGQPMSAHWGIDDPAAVPGEQAQRQAVSDAFRQLTRRISIFVSLPIDKLDAVALKSHLDDIGRLRERGE